MAAILINGASDKSLWRQRNGCFVMNLVFFFSFLFLLLRLFIECGPMHAAAVVESENLQELVGSPLLPQRSVSGLQALSRLVGLLREGEDGGRD